MSEQNEQQKEAEARAYFEQKKKEAMLDVTASESQRDEAYCAMLDVASCLEKGYGVTPNGGHALRIARFVYDNNNWTNMGMAPKNKAADMLRRFYSEGVGCNANADYIKTMLAHLYDGRSSALSDEYDLLCR
ncbi:MAG: hypothetical protein IJS82_05015 [Paludibacteraceae bacterium]|nr:hypothetical protein [Paludibacteraceae bacterium]